MSTSNGTASTPTITPLPQHKSGIRSALEYTGIPSSWFNKRPKLPSRNWLIFLSVTSSITGLYIYDRQQCKKIRREYIDRVQHLAEVPTDAMAWPRKVTAYGCKWPGDEEYDQSMKFFRKYVKPIFVAAAIDFDMINGRRHGELTRRIADEIKARRRLDLGIDKPPVPPMPLPTHRSREEIRRQELNGGIVIVGRHTFKEFMAGLKRGWTDGLEKIDRDELLARELEADGRFDEPDDPPPLDEQQPGSTTMSESHTTIPSPTNSPVFSPLQTIRQSQSHAPRPASSSTIPPSLNEPPAIIPPLPPLLLVPFTNYVGFKLIPLMIADFFYQRRKVRAGAEAAFCLVTQNTRPFEAPAASDAPTPFSRPATDLDFDRNAESYYKKSLSSTPDDIEKARKKYYEGLAPKLVTARAIARNIRELTKDEREHPPPTEVELRAERMKKEKRWRGDLEGWDIVKPRQEVAWDDRFADALRIFIGP